MSTGLYRAKLKFGPMNWPNNEYGRVFFIGSFWPNNEYGRVFLIGPGPWPNNETLVYSLTARETKSSLGSFAAVMKPVLKPVLFRLIRNLSQSRMLQWGLVNRIRIRRPASLSGKSNSG